MAGSKFPVFPAFLIAIAGFVLSGCGGGGGGSGSIGFGSLTGVPIDGIASAAFLGRLELAQGATPYTSRRNQPGGASGDIGDDSIDERTEFTANGEIIFGNPNTAPLVDSSLVVVQRPPADSTQEEPDAEITFTAGGGGQTLAPIFFNQYTRPGDDDEEPDDQSDGSDEADPRAHINLIGNDDLSNIGVIVALEHQAFGVWVRDFGGAGEPGAASFHEDIPENPTLPDGSAAYEGGALGVLREGQARHFTAAELNANVNFNTNKYEITTSGTHRVELREGAEAIPAPDLDFTASGNVNGAKLDTGDADGKTSDYIGRLQGGLFGEGAEEIGGTFRLDNDQGAIYTGSFGAIRQEPQTP